MAEGLRRGLRPTPQPGKSLCILRHLTPCSKRPGRLPLAALPALSFLFLFFPPFFDEIVQVLAAGLSCPAVLTACVRTPLRRDSLPELPPALAVRVLWGVLKASRTQRVTNPPGEF